MKSFFLLFLLWSNVCLFSQTVYESPVGLKFTFDKTWKRLPKEALQKRMKDVKEFLEYNKDFQFDACYQKIGNADMDYPYMLFKNIYSTISDDEQIRNLKAYFTSKPQFDKAIQKMTNGKIDIEIKIGKNYYDERKRILIFTYDMGISLRGDIVGMNAFCIGKSACIQICSYSYRDEFKYDQKEFLDVIYSIQDKGMKSSMSNYVDMHNLAINYYNQGKEHSLLGRREDAIRCYTKAIESYPQEDSYLKSEAYYNRALNKRYMNNLRGAISDYTEAIKLRPDYYKAFNNRGYARLMLEEYQLAITDFTQTIKYDNFNTEYTGMALGNRGLAKFSIGQNGCEDLKMAIENGNNNVIKIYDQQCR